MLTVIKSFLKPFFELSASKPSGTTQSLIRSDVAPPPIKWVSDKFIWNAATQEPIAQGTNGTMFLGIMKQFYECVEKYNETKHSSKKVALFVTDEVDQLLRNVLPRPAQDCVPIRNLDGFAFFQGGKYYKAYYLDNFEDVGFCVYKDGEQKSYAYFRVVKPTVEDLSAFMEQVVHRKDRDPKLHF